MLVGIFVAGVIALILWNLFFKKEDPIDKLPGPTRMPFFGNSFQLMTIPPDKVLDFIVECTNKYGKRYVFAMPPNIKGLHLVGAEDVEVVLSDNKNIKKSMTYEFLSNWLGSGLLVSTGAHWHRRRKILTPAFHFNILKNFATVMEEKTHDMVKFLRDENSKAVNVMPMISNFTLYTICETAMGTKLDKDQSAASLEYKDAILNIGINLLRRITRFWLHSDLIYKNTPSGRSFNKTLDVAKSFADNVIMERKAKRSQNALVTEVLESDGVGSKKRLAMLDLLLEAEEKGQIDMEGIRDEVNTFMFEGHDTTAMAITFAIMELADFEDIQERIYQEGQNILAGDDRLFTIADLAEMKYLEAVIKETLRLYPSVPIIGRSVVEDFKLSDGLLVKRGTTINIHFFELHRDPEVFPEPLKFKPERFLEHENRHPYAYVPFSAGPRNCIGQRFAMQEMKIMLSEIIRNFKLVPKTKGARPRLLVDLVLRPADPIEVKFVPR